MADKGNVVYNTSKLVFIAGPLILIICLAFSVHQIITKEYFYGFFAGGIFVLALVLFFMLSLRNRETVWENCGGILYFPSPLPRIIRFKDVKIAYPLYSYSPSTKKMVTSKLCLLDKKGNLFVFRNLDAVAAVILGLSTDWKKVYIYDYDIQNLTKGQQARMKMLLGFSNNFARLLKFLMFFVFGFGVIIVGYFVLRVEMDLYLFLAALLCALVAYFGSIFIIGALLIQRENTKRRIMRMKQARLTKKLDRKLLRKFLSSEVPDYDGDYDMFTEIAVEFGKGPPREEVKPLEKEKKKNDKKDSRDITESKNMTKHKPRQTLDSKESRKKGRTKGSKRSTPSKYSKKH